MSTSTDRAPLRFWHWMACFSDVSAVISMCSKAVPEPAGINVDATAMAKAQDSEMARVASIGSAYTASASGPEVSCQFTAF